MDLSWNKSLISRKKWLGSWHVAKFSRLSSTRLCGYIGKLMRCCCFWRCSSCFAEVSAPTMHRDQIISMICNYDMIMLFLLLMNRSMIPPSNQIFYWIIKTKNMTKNTSRWRFPLRGYNPQESLDMGNCPWKPPRTLRWTLDRTWWIHHLSIGKHLWPHSGGWVGHGARGWTCGWNMVIAPWKNKEAV